MKLKNLTYGLLATAMLASCSDDMNVNGPAANGGENLTTGFIGVTIGMPSDGATRGVNDNFDDGTVGEYAVNSAAIIFFKGPEENGSTFYRAYNLSNAFDGYADTPNQITSQQTATFPVDFAKEADERLWAMAVINYGQADIQIVNGENKNSSATVTIAGQAVDASWTIERFMSQTTDRAMYNGTGASATNFFMVNTPYSRVQGGIYEPGLYGGNDFRVLADVDRSRIYETEDEAKQNPATEIFVERAVAKVDITADLENLAAGLPGGVKVSKVEWVLNNTEPQSYVVRNLQKVGAGFHVNSTPEWATYTSEYLAPSPNYYRFIGQAPLKDFAKYRTYFCEDPNGDGLDANGTTTLNIAENPVFKAIGVANPQYCHENTFSVANMNTFNTTCAMIKVTYEDADGNTPTFYTIGLNNTQMFTFENAARVLAVDVISNGDIQDAVKNYFENKGEAYDNNISTSDLDYTKDADSPTLTANNEWMKITFSNTLVEGRLVISELTLYNGKTGDRGEEITTYKYGDEVITDLNAVQEVKAYTQGVSYYSVLIKHFGDEYTPWNPTTLGITETTPTTEESYFTKANPEQNFLGRYGVVRNNWYSINLTKINNFGEPTVKDIHFDGTPDDKYEKEEAISCRINILSWAKRSQSAEL